MAGAFIPISQELLDDFGPGLSLDEWTFALSPPLRRVELRARWLRQGHVPARWWYEAQDDWVEALGAG